MRVYATAEQYEQFTFGPAPADIDGRLTRASMFLDAQVFRTCWYEVTSTGYPANATVAEAFARAVCAQAEWNIDVGDLTGAGAAGWGSVEIGDVKLSRSVTSVSGADSPARQVAPGVGDALRGPDLTPAVFSMGVVTTC